MIGGTGRMGRQVVSALEAQGVRAVSLSRRTGFDLVEGTGAQLAGKLEGCAAAVDCSEVGRGAEDLRRAAVRLRQAAQAAGVQRLVVVSIVGVDRPGLARIAYYRGKLVQERTLAAGALPVCVVRSTQWYEFADMIYVAAPLGRLGRIGLAPRMACQPVAGRFVADRLVRAALAEAPAPSVEVAGPQVVTTGELIRRVNAARGTRARICAVPVPGVPGFSDGSLLPGPDAELDTLTVEEWAGSSPA